MAPESKAYTILKSVEMRSCHTVCDLFYHILQFLSTSTTNKVHVHKSVVHPITCHGGPDRVQRYSSTLSLTSALDEGGWLTPRPGRFIPENDPVPKA
jgi:hypothetical protein